MKNIIILNKIQCRPKKYYEQEDTNAKSLSEVIISKINN